MTYVSHRRIFQSGDFRLTDLDTGQLVDAWAQKEIVIQHFGWIAVMGFCGVASTGVRPLPDWIVARLRELPQNATFDDFIRSMVWAESWLKNVPARRRALTFSIGAFVDLKPTFVLISNFEAVGRSPRTLPRELPAKLDVTRYRPKKEQLFLSGRPAAVTPKERLLLLGAFRKGPTRDSAYATLAKLNRRAATRDGSISPACFTAHVTAVGESGGLVHDWPDHLDYLPEFTDPHGWFLPQLARRKDEHGRPQPLQLKSMSAAMSVDSEEYFRIALDENPEDPSILNNHGNWLMKHGKVPDAERAYRRAIELDDAHASAHGNLALLLDQALDDPDQAEVEHRRAVELEPETCSFIINLAGFLWMRKNQVAEAEALFRHATEIKRDAFTLGRRALFLYEALHDEGTATALYEEALALAPSDAWLNAQYGTLLWHTRKDAHAARPYLEKGTAPDAVPSDALCLRAQFEIGTGNISAAIALLERARREFPRSADAIANLAAARSLGGIDTRKVERGYRAALALDSKHPVAALNLAQLLLLRNDADGRREAQLLLAAALAHPNVTDELRIEGLFYGFAHECEGYENAPEKIFRLLSNGVRIEHWPLEADVRAARARRHDQVDLVAELARRITAETDRVPITRRKSATCDGLHG